jgi:hypothetical protein
MRRDVEVQDLASLVPDHEEAVKQPEGQGGHGKEVHGGEEFPMIGEEGEPAFGRIAAAWLQPSKIPGDGRFGDIEAEFQQFAVDLRRAPVRIL